MVLAVVLAGVVRGGCVLVGGIGSFIWHKGAKISSGIYNEIMSPYKNI